MGAGRRSDIVAVARRRGLWILEDDIYAPFAEGAPPPIAALAPERTFYVSSLSKAVAPGLRTGFIVAPGADDLERITPIVRARCYAPNAFGHQIAASWIEDGSADDIAGEVREEVRARTALAKAALGPWLDPATGEASPHLWLPMGELQAERLAAAAARAGVELTPPSAPVVDPALARGVRVCIGAARERAALEAGLKATAEALAGGARAAQGLV
jgi:DNA-binding transcriptional MocR family regulator